MAGSGLVVHLPVLGHCEREIVQRLLSQHGRKRRTSAITREPGEVDIAVNIPNACMLTETASVKQSYQLDKPVKEVALGARTGGQIREVLHWSCACDATSERTSRPRALLKHGTSRICLPT